MQTKFDVEERIFTAFGIIIHLYPNPFACRNSKERKHQDLSYGKNYQNEQGYLHLVFYASHIVKSIVESMIR